MNPAKVVVHKVQGHGMSVVLNLLAESVCKARKTAHPHAHRQILPFDKRSADVLGVGIAADRGRAASDAGRRAIAAFVQAGWHPVNLDQHTVVNVCAKGIFDGIHVNPMAVRGELNPA